MYMRLSRVSRGLAFILILVILFAQGVSHFDPYQLAAQQMGRELDANPGLEQRFTDYGNKARQWRQTFRTDLAHPIVALIDLAKDGNVWERILDAADDYFPMGSVFIVGLENLSREIAELDIALVNISLAQTASPKLGYLHTPQSLTHEDLETIYASCALMYRGLGEIDQDLGSIATSIRRITTLPQYDTAVNQLGEMSNLPGLGGLAAAGWNGLTAWRNMPYQIDEIQAQLDRDITTLEKMQQWYQLAVVTEAILANLRIRSSANWVNSNLEILLAALTWTIAGAVGGWVGHQAKQRRSSPQRRVRVAAMNQTTAVPNIRLDAQQPVQCSDQAKFIQPAQVRLECHWDDGRKQTFPLTNLGAITFGSALSDTVRTTTGRSTPTQAMVRRARKHFYLQVLGDQIQTLLNNQPVTGARTLKNEDKIQVGDVTAVFTN